MPSTFNNLNRPPKPYSMAGSCRFDPSLIERLSALASMSSLKHGPSASIQMFVILVCVLVAEKDVQWRIKKPLKNLCRNRQSSESKRKRCFHGREGPKSCVSRKGADNANFSAGRTKQAFHGYVPVVTPIFKLFANTEHRILSSTVPVPVNKLSSCTVPIDIVAINSGT